MTAKRQEHRRPLAISWSHRARNDLIAIGEYIAADNPSAAGRWIERLISAVERASRLPLSGRIVPEYSDRQDLREVLVRNYRIVYRVGPHTLEVLTIFEGHRLFPPEVLPENDDSTG